MKFSVLFKKWLLLPIILVIMWLLLNGYLTPMLGPYVGGMATGAAMFLVAIAALWLYRKMGKNL